MRIPSWRSLLTTAASASLLGCVPVAESASERPECPPVTADIAAPVAPPSHRYFILVDRSSSYADYLPHALALLRETVGPLATGNSSFHVSWIGSRSGGRSEAAIPVMGQPAPTGPVVAPPAIPPPPLLRLPVTPEGATDALRFKMAQEVSRLEARHNCDLTTWVESADSATRAWQEQQARADGAYRERMDGLLATLAPRVDPTGTHIYEAVFDAADTLARLGADRKTLIIFSDMDEERVSRAEEGRLDLTGVHVVVALMPYTSPADLTAKTGQWKDFFVGRGATSVTVFAAGSTSADALVRSVR